MHSEISDRFRALAARPESQTGLAEGALILASEVRPEMKIDAVLALLDELTERISPLVEAAETPSAAVVSTETQALSATMDVVRGATPDESAVDDQLQNPDGLAVALATQLNAQVGSPVVEPQDVGVEVELLVPPPPPPPPPDSPPRPPPSPTPPPSPPPALPAPPSTSPSAFPSTPPSTSPSASPSASSSASPTASPAAASLRWRS